MVLIKRNLFILILTCLSLVTFASYGQSDSGFVGINKSYFKSVLKDTKDLVLFPKTTSIGQWCLFGGVVVADAVLIHGGIDKKTEEWFLKNQSKEGDLLFSNIGEKIGSGVISYPIVVATGLAGYIFKDERILKTSLLCVKSIGLTGLVVTPLKYGIERHRPYQDTPSNPFKFEGPVTTRYHSMPSGHTSNAFSIAAMYAFCYKDKPWVGITSYTLATLTGLSRMYDHKHWASDVLTGAAIGTAVSYLIYKHDNWKTKGLKKRKHVNQDS